MHTTVQNGVTVIVSKFVTEVGGTQTTVSQSAVLGRGGTRTHRPPRLDRDTRSDAAQYSQPTLPF
jgi:hypothetical protein